MARSSANGNAENRDHLSSSVPPASRHTRRSLLGAGGILLGGIAGTLAGRPASDTDAATPEPAASPVPAIPNASAFMLLRNTGERPDRLIAATTDAAERVVFRTFDDAEGVRREHMDPIDVSIPAGETVVLAPGKAQLLLLDVRRVLPPSTWFALALTFAHAGVIAVPVNVRWGGAPIITNVNRANRYTSGDITAIEPWAFPVGQAEIVTPIPATPVASPAATPEDGD